MVHLHSQDPPMIHRDVKAQNVLLTGEGKGEGEGGGGGGGEGEGDSSSISIHSSSSSWLDRTKVADFGCVHGNEDAINRGHVITDEIIGTRPYMPTGEVSG